MEDRSPIVVQVPVSLLATAVRIPLNARTIVQSTLIIRIEGFLAQLTSGTFSVEIKDLFDGSVLGTISWTAPGFSTTGDISRTLDQEASGLGMGATSIGVGASGCTLIIWPIMMF